MRLRQSLFWGQLNQHRFKTKNSFIDFKSTMEKGKTVQVQVRSAKYQYLAALVVSLTTIGFGVFEGWTSPSIFLLTHDDTPLPSGKISTEESSWVASLQCVGNLFGNVLFGYIINNFGRKIPLMIIVFPIIMSWLLTWFAQNVYYLYAARLLGGFFSGGGGYMIVPLFLSEISSDHVRGTLVSTLVLSENFGMLLAFVIGNYFDFYAIPTFGIILMIAFLISVYFLPESPLFLLKQNKVTEAENALRFYQNIQNTEQERKLLDREMDKLRITLTDVDSTNGKEKSLKWSDFTTKIAQNALLIGVVMVAMNQFTGVVAILSYTATIFEEAGSSLPPNMSAIVIGIIQVIGNCLATYLVDRSGRKLLLIISNIGTALGLIVLGFYMMIRSWGVNVDAFSWIPVASLSFVIFVASLGILTLPLIVISETMPEKIKDTTVSFCMSLLWIFSFISIKYLQLLIDVISFHGSMFLFSGVCVGSAMFVLLFLPETKNRSHEEIMRSLE